MASGMTSSQLRQCQRGLGQRGSGQLGSGQLGLGQIGLGRLGGVAAVALLAVSVTACGQFAGLKARKHLKDAHALYQQQDYRKAAAEYEEALKADPELKAAYFYLGNSYDNMYKPARRGESVNDSYLDEAVKYYQQSVDKLASSTDPQEVELRKRSLQYLAAVYASDKKNEPEKAEPVVKQLIDMDPKDTTNYLGLAKIYEDAGQFDKAEEQMKKAEAAAPNSVDVILQMSEYYNRRGEFDKAITAFHRVSELEPTNPQHFTNIALRYEEKVRKDYTVKPPEKVEYIKKGLESVDKALAIRPDYFEALTYKNLLLRQQALVEPKRSKELIEEAEKYLKKAIEIQNRQQKGVA
jgi:tetratricopeptide (TPR) repeat protein